MNTEVIKILFKSLVFTPSLQLTVCHYSLVGCSILLLMQNLLLLIMLVLILSFSSLKVLLTLKETFPSLSSQNPHLSLSIILKLGLIFASIHLLQHNNIYLWDVCSYIDLQRNQVGVLFFNSQTTKQLTPLHPSRWFSYMLS